MRKDCNYCKLFTKHLMGTDLERLFNIVDVENNPVDPRQVHSVRVTFGPTSFTGKRGLRGSPWPGVATRWHLQACATAQPAAHGVKVRAMVRSVIHGHG